MIDWNAPLEAVDKDTGEVFAVTCAGKIPGPHAFGKFCYQAAWVASGRNISGTEPATNVFDEHGEGIFWRVVNAK